MMNEHWEKKRSRGMQMNSVKPTREIVNCKDKGGVKSNVPIFFHKLQDIAIFMCQVEWEYLKHCGQPWTNLC